MTFGVIETIDLKRGVIANILALGSIILDLYFPIASLLMAAGVLSIVDIILGMIKAIKIDKVKLESKKFFNKLKQFGLFWSLISCAIISGPAFEEFGYSFYS